MIIIDNNFWDKFDFAGGRIAYAVADPTDDMLLVEYPADVVLDVGLFKEKLRVRVVSEENWTKPDAEYSCADQAELEKAVRECLEVIKEKTAGGGKAAGDLWEALSNMLS